jgi:hypothetical protein
LRGSAEAKENPHTMASFQQNKKQRERKKREEKKRQKNETKKWDKKMRQQKWDKREKKKQKKSISDHPRPYQKRKKQKIHKAPPQIEPYRAMRVQTIDTPHTVKDKFFLHFQIGLVVVNAANVRGTIGADKDQKIEKKR